MLAASSFMLRLICQSIYYVELNFPFSLLKGDLYHSILSFLNFSSIPNSISQRMEKKNNPKTTTTTTKLKQTQVSAAVWSSACTNDITTTF